MRLGNLQVVNIFTDGPWCFCRNWLRRNDRDLVSLAWRLANDRQIAGLGRTTVLHQVGHPEKRNWASQYDTHEVYNSKVDALTHQIDDAMPLYVSFRRALRGHTTIWHESLEEENVGHEGCQPHHYLCTATAVDRAGWRERRRLPRHVRQGRDRSRSV